MSNPYARPGSDEDIFSYEFSSVSIAPLSVPPATARPVQPGPSPPFSSGAGVVSSPVISPGSQGRPGYYSMHAPPDYVPPRISPPVRITRPPGPPALVAHNGKPAKAGLVDSPGSRSPSAGSKALPIVKPVEINSNEDQTAREESGWDSLNALLDQYKAERDKLEQTNTSLQAERTTLNAQVSIMQNQLDNVEQIRRAYEDRLKTSSGLVDKLKADKENIIAQAQDKLSQQSAAMNAREGQLMQHISNYEKAHTQAARDMYALDDVKRAIQLELDSSQQQVDMLQQRVDVLQSQLTAQVQHQPTSQHREWDALLVQENDELRQKIELVVHEMNQIAADRANEADQTEALRREVNAFQEDKADLEEAFALVRAEREAATDDKREAEQALQHVQLENAKLRAKDISPRSGSRLDTPPHSPEYVRRFPSFANDGGAAGDMGQVGADQSQRTPIRSRLSFSGRNSADSAGLLTGTLRSTPVGARSSERSPLSGEIGALPQRPASSERPLSATCTSVAIGRTQSGPAFGVGIRRAPQGPPTPGATSFHGTRTPPATIPGLTRDRPQPIGMGNASNTASSVWYSTPRRDSSILSPSAGGGTSWETMRKSMGLGEGVGATGGSPGGAGGGGDRVPGTVFASGRLSGSALDWQWRRTEGKEGGNDEREERRV